MQLSCITLPVRARVVPAQDSAKNLCFMVPGALRGPASRADLWDQTNISFDQN